MSRSILTSVTAVLVCCRQVRSQFWTLEQGLFCYSMVSSVASSSPLVFWRRELGLEQALELESAAGYTEGDRLGKAPECP